jgi:hypothetical protein
MADLSIPPDGLLSVPMAMESLFLPFEFLRNVPNAQP